MHESICNFLLDIIQNAIEAHSRVITIAVKDTNTSFTCRVIDNGKGMSESELERIRDPFYTDGVKHTKRRVGLGIPFLEQAVNLSDGSSSIESVKGEGTEIMFSFPTDHIDTPPVGNIPSTFFAALTYPGDFEMHIHYALSRDTGNDEYELHRNELIDILGDLSMGQSLIMLRDFIKSQDEDLEELRKNR